MQCSEKIFGHTGSTAPEVERRIRANEPAFNAQFNYANNYICTSKYTLLSFLPKNILEQFLRLANAYFLGLLILQSLPWITALPFYTTLAPLVIVLGITCIKDGLDDYRRHKNDDMVNRRTSLVLRHGKIVEEEWQNVVVGDIIKMENNHFVAADLLLLSSSEPNSLCYIETAELDGETNLKVRQALPDTATIADDVDKLAAFNGEIICEPPNNRLPKFEGKLTWKDETYSLDNDNILLRGCVLRNTQWCYGLVVFSGHDSKLMMNSGKAVFKRTNIDRLMNQLIIGIFLFLLTMCLVCTVACGIWEKTTGSKFQVYMPWESFVPGSIVNDKGGSETAGETTIYLLVFFSYIIILNTVVPISLYVSVEIIRMGNSLLINWDNKMYYEPKDDPAKARTTALNEELGQIEYIFSDKTGTLTQNIMAFKKASLDESSYGGFYDTAGHELENLSDDMKPCDFSWNKYADPSFEFYDQKLINLVQSGDKHAHEFFRLLSLCHTVMPEEDNGKIEYQAQSPDEGALVSAARNFGFVFKSRTPTTITIEVMGVEEVYDLLAILDFDNVRKRMSVIVRRDDQIQLWCKGADTIIYERLDHSNTQLLETTKLHLNDFAVDGLRTLCLAKKDLTEQQYKEWSVKYKLASIAMENRDEKLNEVYEEIEQGMVLLGATAIEDKLQDGVPDAIANLAVAGIKIWVLTGDKQETAVNIGYSCRLLTDEMEDVFIIDADSFDNVKKQMEEALNKINDPANDPLNRSNELMDTESRSGIWEYIQMKVSRLMMSSGESYPVRFQPHTGIPRDKAYALVINGHSLVHCLTPQLEHLLLELGCSCKAVICCRVTPGQKADVVDLIKRNKQTITLAIGDGANDVNMIKTAHIGVGISGQEGMQAVLSSDYSFSQFRYLERLLLVHGRWSYLRMCKFLKYFFYKNFSFTLCSFWFAFFCGYSAQALFDPNFISFYNVFYTSLPILMLGFFDQDVNDEHSTKYPKLYQPGLENLLFNKTVFGLSVLEGVISSLVLFFIPYGAFLESVNPDGLDVSGVQSFGLAVATILVVSVNLRCALDMSYWTWCNHFVTWGSIIFYFCLVSIMYIPALGYQYQGATTIVFTSATFWLTMLLTNVILLVPVIAYRFYTTHIKATLSDRVRLKQRLEKSRIREEHMGVYKTPSSRHSHLSVRSGYAFSHDHGFADLITSGRIMRNPFKKGNET